MADNQILATVRLNPISRIEFLNSINSCSFVNLALLPLTQFRTAVRQTWNQQFKTDAFERWRPLHVDVESKVKARSRVTGMMGKTQLCPGFLGQSTTCPRHVATTVPTYGVISEYSNTTVSSYLKITGFNSLSCLITWNQTSSWSTACRATVLDHNMRMGTCKKSEPQRVSVSIHGDFLLYSKHTCTASFPNKLAGCFIRPTTAAHKQVSQQNNNDNIHNKQTLFHFTFPIRHVALTFCFRTRKDKENAVYK